MHLPSEWSPQSFVQLTLPSLSTDWRDDIDNVVSCYRDIALAISHFEPLLAIVSDNSIGDAILHDIRNVIRVEAPINDTWSRDHGFITCIDSGECLYMDFQFNGWGLKFASDKDNQLNRHLWESGHLPGHYVNHLDFVLEGGSIESDGKGTLLTTSSCLLAPNRNILSKGEIESKLASFFNVRRILWLDHGRLSGDDTDGHIDTMARLCPNDTITYVSCDDPYDEHFSELTSMKQDLESFQTIEGTPYHLVGLPLPDAIYDDGVRLPATYANFLIVNGGVIYPTYSQPEKDRMACEILQKVFPSRKVVGVDCLPLIRQHGSLHCCTMQYPQAK